MLTKVVLDGPMGRQFGREWNLKISSPVEALKLVECNKPGIFNWIRANLKKYESYRVTCKYRNGNVEAIGQNEYFMEGEIEEIRFTPLITGSGGNNSGIMMIIMGVVMLVAAFFTAGASLGAWGAAMGAGSAGMAGMNATVVMMTVMGAGMVISGMAAMLSPMPSVSGNEVERKNKTSKYFDGGVNTEMQGVPIQLIYGEVVAGSHAIHASLSVSDRVI